MPNTHGHRGWGHIRKLPSGHYQASYVGPYSKATRHHGPITYSVRELAERWLAAERRLIEEGKWSPPATRTIAQTAPAVTVAGYAKTWIAERKLRPGTRAEYESKLRLHIEPTTLGGAPIAELTPQLVRAWYAGLGVPTVAQLAALADAVPERFKALILLKAWCGMRFGEVIELRRHDIDNGAEVVYISRGATHRNSKCHIGTTKQKQSHAVVIPPHIRADIKHHLDVHVAKGADALLFPPARGGCHLNDRVFRDYLQPALVKAGIPASMRVHDLKHYAGTMTARVASVAETMSRLGHRTVKASLIYQSVVSGRDAEIAAALSELATAE